MFTPMYSVCAATPEGIPVTERFFTMPKIGSIESTAAGVKFTELEKPADAPPAAIATLFGTLLLPGRLMVPAASTARLPAVIVIPAFAETLPPERIARVLPVIEMFAVTVTLPLKLLPTRTAL